MMPKELEFVLRIALAVFCGGVIGYERERRLKKAGIRTHLIVALAAALMMVVSKYGFLDVAGVIPGVSVDASRVAAGVVTAIGFLGAGVIFVRKDTVSGVTTSAGLWATVGVGLTVGSGMYFTGIAATVLIVVIQVVFYKNGLLVRHHRPGSVVLVMEEARMDETTVGQILDGVVERIDSITILHIGDGQVEMRCEVTFTPEMNDKSLPRAVRAIPELRSAELDQTI